MKWSFLGEFKLFHRVKKFYFRPGKELRFRNDGCEPLSVSFPIDKVHKLVGYGKAYIYPLKPNPTLQVIIKTSANALDKPSENSRHRGDTYTPPRWRFSFTAVTLSRHRGESYFSKARSEKNFL